MDALATSRLAELLTILNPAQEIYIFSHVSSTETGIKTVRSGRGKGMAQDEIFDTDRGINLLRTAIEVIEPALAEAKVFVQRHQEDK